MSGRWQDLRTRSLSALVLAAVVLFITWWDAVSFDALLILVAALFMREWVILTRERHAIFILFGLIYIALAAYSLAALRHIYGWQAIYLVFGLVWVGDITAYFIGKLFGKHKIAPAISPGKSWEGLVGAVVASALFAAALFTWHWHYLLLITTLSVGAGFAVTGLIGDMFESALKRKAGVKDSGTLIPGHGGLFDRIDALIPCSILAAVLVFFVY